MAIEIQAELKRKPIGSDDLVNWVLVDDAENTDSQRSDPVIEYGLRNRLDDLSALLASQIVVSIANSTGTPLGAGATYSGTFEDITKYEEVSVNVFGNPSNAKGTLYFEFSPNGINADVSVPLLVDDLNVVIPFPLRTVLPYFRVRYINDAVAQTEFRLTTILHRTSAKHLTRTPTQTIGPQEPVEVVRALIEPGPNFGSRRLLGADRDVFGVGITMSRINQISADFSRALTANLVTSIVSGGGATAQANGQATMTTGTAATATARLQSSKSITYKPFREEFAAFTVRFTTPTSANSHQRAGLYDDNNGFFLGYWGTTFGFTVRKGAVDTFVALTNANGDPLDASFRSRFSRAGRLEAIDHTKVNVWRIRFGWLGSSVIHFEVQSPDGEWMTVHSILQPNLSTAPSIQNPNLPLRMEAIKSSADATSLVMGTGSWAAGIVDDAASLRPSERRPGVFYRDSVDAVTAATTVIHTVTSGLTFYLTSILISAINNSLTVDGLIRVTDAGSPRIPAIIVGQKTAGSGAPGSVATPDLSEPIAFTTNVRLDLVAGTLTASCLVVGYEE